MTTTNIIKTLGAADLDTKELVTNLVAATKAPRQQLIDRDKKKNDVAISSAALLSSALSTLQSTASEIGGLPKLNKLIVASGDSTVVTAGPSTAGAAKSGTHSIEVVQLARSQRTLSTALASGFSSAATSLSFAGGSSFTAGSVEIDAALTPAQIVTRINSSDVAKSNQIKASLINTNKNSPYVIVIEGASGGANSFTIDDSTGNQFGFETGANTVSSAANSIVRINSVEIERSSNIVADAVTGLSINLNSVKSGAVSLTVSSDASAVVGNIKNFVEAYNLASDFIKKATGPLIEGDDIAGSLRADTNARSVLMKLREKLIKESSSSSGTVTHWGSIGVSFDRDGVLKFDESKFTKAFESQPDDVIRSLSNNAPSPYLASGNSSGLAGDVAIAAYGMTRSTGIVKLMTTGFEAKKSRVIKKQAELDSYIEKLTNTYETQYASLNNILAQFKATSARLTANFNPPSK